MTPIKNFPEIPPPGLTLNIENEGIILICEGGVWKTSNPDRVATIAVSYDPTTYVKAEKAAELADARWQKETGGFLFQPAGSRQAYRFHSSREAMGPVMGAMLAVQAGVFPDPTMWKTIDGFVAITAKDVPGLFQAFAAHVAACFAEEHTKQEEVRIARWEDAQGIEIALTVKG